MKDFLTSHILLSIHLVIIALFAALSAWYVSHALSESTRVLQSSIDTQIERISQLALKTDSNDVDESIGAIVLDCPSRQEFESLLSTLGTLQNKELIRVQQLFGTCGTFYAERKALMVSRLGREYEVLLGYASALNALADTEGIQVSLADWKSLIQLERDRSNHLSEITLIQGKIISALIDKEPDTQTSIDTLVAEAQSLAETMAVIDQQIDTLRAGLVP